MMRFTAMAFMMACGLLLGACAEGSTTTIRPAIDKPVIGPDGTFWDAISAAKQNDPRRMEFIFSTRFLHRSILPNVERKEVSDEEEYMFENARMKTQLAPFAVLVSRMHTRYTSWLRERTKDRLVEAEKPSYDIKFKDGFGSARGPNTASIKVNLYAKNRAGAPGESFVVSFVQEGDSWKLDGFKPDPLFGEFIR